jgi:hypothetical protein
MALSINIQNTPSKNLIYKMYPVYNGLPFVITTNRAKRSNFKYIADIFVAGTKVTQLKHNKDISANDSGIFDIGRVVENFITTTPASFNTYGFAGNIEEYKSYQVKFGAEYDRYLSFYQILNSGGFARVYFQNSDHDLRIGDSVTIQNASNSTYNGTWTITSVSSASVVINKSYVGTAKGLAIEGERFYDNQYYNNPALGIYVGFAIPNSRATRINVGDTVVIKQDAGATFAGYDGEWLVIDKKATTIAGSPYTNIIINSPFLGSTGVQGGNIYSKAKYNFTGTTTSTLEYTWDAALQYEDINQWNPNLYAMNLTNKGKFLTNAPITQYIRSNESMTLTSFNTTIMGSSTIKKGVFKTYNSAGVLQATYSHNLAGTALTTAIINTGVGTKNLVNLNANALTGDVQSYTYEYQNITGGTISEVRKFILDKECFRYTQKRFKWKNRMGGWDFFTFNLRSNKSVSIDRSTYRKALNHYKPAVGVVSPSYGYNVGDRGNNVYNVKATDSELVFSNWLSNDEAAWLEELFTSPEVYIFDDAGITPLPIILTDTSLTIGEKENIGLISYSINYTKAYNKNIQRG